jgi:Uma2 family endonuclease
MADDRSQVSDGLYMTEEQYLALDEATDGPCVAYSSDVKLKVGTTRHYFHPGVSMACGNQAGNMLTDPEVVIEVLSPATEKRDRGAKFTVYKTLPSVQEYRRYYFFA